MSHFLARTFCLFLLVSLTACGGGNKFKIEDRAESMPTVPIKVGVPAFDDQRGFDEYVNRGITMIPIVGIRGGYYYDRHDDVYKGATEPFPELAARTLAERLNEADVFVDAVYLKSPGMPNLGEYDVIIDGRINRLRSVGYVYRYGLSIFGDIPWLIGFPSLDRHWDIEFQYRLLNGYTGEPITEFQTVQHKTTTTFLTRYYHRGKTADLVNDIDPVDDEFIDWFWANQPVNDTQYWANLQEEGREYVARLKSEQETAKKGTPPTFVFLSPSEGSTVRNARVPVRWSITAPNGLKTAALVVNNQAVELPIDAMSMVKIDTSPKAVPATEVMVPLKIGGNEFRALVVDHRGNETTANFMLTRLPTALRPEQRFALLIGAGGSNDQASVDTLSEVLADPLVGQFAEGDIQELKTAELSKAQIQEALAQFGARPLSGNLVFVYLRTQGNWDTMTIGDGTLTLDEFIGMLEGSLATTEVVLAVDIDWSGSGGDEINNRLSNLPSRWAFLTSQSAGGSSPNPGLSEMLVKTMVGDPVNPRRLTIERLMDAMLNALEDSSSGYKPGAYGRYDSSFTMVERE